MPFIWKQIQKLNVIRSSHHTFPPGKIGRKRISMALTSTLPVSHIQSLLMGLPWLIVIQVFANFGSSTVLPVVRLVNISAGNWGRLLLRIYGFQMDIRTALLIVNHPDGCFSNHLTLSSLKKWARVTTLML